MRRYRKNRNDLYEPEAIVLMFIAGIIITIFKSVHNFITKNYILILSISSILLVAIVLIIIIIKYRDILNFIIEMKKRKIMKKLKKNSLLYSKIMKLNEEYEFNIFPPYYIQYSVYRKSDLSNCNIDDYLLMAIESDNQNIEKYKAKYNMLLSKINEYKLKYNELRKYIDYEEANRLKIKKFDYEICQNRIFEDNKISSQIEFAILVYVNYSSVKGLVRDKRYKKYDMNEYNKLYSEYLNLKEKNRLYEINSRVERAKMSESLRYDILKRDNYKCQICGASAKDGAKLQVDHIIPVSKGGKTEPNNLQTLCARCNIGKSNKLD